MTSPEKAIRSSPHPAILKVSRGLYKLFLRVHDERSTRGDRLVNGRSTQQQDLSSRLLGDDAHGRAFPLHESSPLGAYLLCRRGGDVNKERGATARHAAREGGGARTLLSSGTHGSRTSANEEDRVMASVAPRGEFVSMENSAANARRSCAIEALWQTQARSAGLVAPAAAGPNPRAQRACKSGQGR